MEEEGLGTRGPKIHIWGAISSRGALSLEIFDHDLNSQHYLKILKKKKKEMKDLFPEGFIFQQDGNLFEIYK